MSTAHAPGRASASAAAAAAPARAPRIDTSIPLRVVEPPVRLRRNPVGVLGTIVVIGLFAAVFGVVVFQVLLVQTQSRLDTLDANVGQQEDRAKQLERQTADLESPDRIVAAARERLDMITPADIVPLQPKADDDQQAHYDPASTATTPATTPTTKATTTPTKATSPATKAAVPTTKATAPMTKATTPTTKATTPTTKATTPTTKKATTATSAKR